jgi:hypothetical protein
MDFPVAGAQSSSPPMPSETRKLIAVVSKVFNRNLGRLLVLVYTLDFLNESADTARLYAAVNLLQTLLSTLNRGIINIGVSNNQKSENKLSPEELMECCVAIGLVNGAALSILGMSCSEGIIPYIIPQAGESPARLSMRLYSLVMPFWITLMNVPSALLGCSTDRSDLPIFLREITSGGLANPIYFFVFKRFAPQSYIYTLILHTIAGTILGRLFLGQYGDMKLRQMTHLWKEKFNAALGILGAGFVEGLLSGIDVFGWMLISWVVSQQEDPRYLLNQLAQIGFTSAMTDSLITIFRKNPPSLKLLLSANATTLSIGIGVSSLLSLIKGADPAPSLYTLTLFPIVGKRIISQIAMDKALDPIITNKKMVNAHLVITLVAVGFIFAGYFSNMPAEHVFLIYPLISAGLGILSSLYYLRSSTHNVAIPAVARNDERVVTIHVNEARPSEIGIFALPAQREEMKSHRHDGTLIMP